MRYINLKLTMLLTIAFMMASGKSWAQALRLDGAFTSNMVLQRDKDVRVFGTAPKSTDVIVKFCGQKVATKSNAEGRFIATLKPMKANAKAQVLTVQCGKEKLELKNVLVGDVWLCGGQSNMEYNMGPTWRSGKVNKVVTPKRGKNIQEEELERAKKLGKITCPLMRAIVIEKELDKSYLPTSGWKMIDGESILPISAVGYFFGKNMLDSLKVPVGLIVSCWGGTRIESWMNPEYSKNDATVSKFITSDGKMDGEPLGNRFNHMIREIAPMSMQGVIWYQGCSNLMSQNWQAYHKKEVSLLKGWMNAFEDEKLGFYYVQLAPYEYSPRKSGLIANTWRDLSEFRNLQMLSEKEFPRSGMAATIDLCDNTKDIHPTYKWEVGRRLALQALRKQFGRKDIVCDGPRCINKEAKGNKIICTFNEKLTTNDGKAPRCFSICNGSSWYVADAVIEGDKVILSCSKMKGNPTKAHFVWDETHVTNLCNKHGLPAFPF